MAERLYKPLLIDTLKAAVNIEKQRFIGFDGNYCGANAKAYGVSDVEIEAEQYAPVALFGILLVKTAGAITAGTRVASDANGYAVAYSTGESNGYALDTAVGAGEIIRIIRGI
ncbi:MAG: capsid cement protein [bacterium]